MKNYNWTIAAEAAFVLCNALTSCSSDFLFEIWQQYSGDLVDPMAIFLRKHLLIQSNHQRILTIFLQSILALLKMESENGITLGETTFEFYFG